MISSPDFDRFKDTMEYLRKVPYDVTRPSLYSLKDLYAGYIQGDDTSFTQCYDTRVYQHFLATGKTPDNANESLARAIHDQKMHAALDEFFRRHDRMLCLGLMGGHALLRTDEMYARITRLSKRLTEQGFIMLSGGGPGAMEAPHLGAWMAGRSDAEVDDALATLADAPKFGDVTWLSTAIEVIKKYPQDTYVSLGMPTWLYGHEPSTPFATHIAKFFENSVREDSILTLACGGIIFTPGSAGTMQEIFQEAVQNHYLSFGFASPMVFLGIDFWTHEMPVYPMLESLMATGRYKNLLLTLTDDMQEVIDVLTEFKRTHSNEHD